MAAIVAGDQYGLSSRISDANTSLIFVKLTDSAYRAIEEYLKNGDRFSHNQKPTIQFLKNEGHLSIPSTQSAQSSRNHVFNFSLSASADEGTFECLRNTAGASKQLESIGALSYQMRIQANEDVYETTRHRMAVAEEQQKKNCTRVIKPNLADIGRKVKVKSGVGNNIVNNNSNSNNNNNNNHHHHTSTNGCSSPFQRLSQHTRIMSNNNAQKPGNPELTRRPIRERLVHLLAVRPYKKPELYERLFRDGIRDRDKSNITQALSQIASMRDNTYHLIRHVWNDVQEDWPFYTEQDRQMLKRRKPQNLTPPGSSDTGSSGSGQSPTSTHPGSPPSAIQGPTKRPGYPYETVDGILSKRQRISHYKKPAASSTTSSLVDHYEVDKERDVRDFVNSTRDYHDYDRPYDDYDDVRHHQRPADLYKRPSDKLSFNTYSSVMKVSSDNINNNNDDDIVNNRSHEKRGVGRRSDSPATVTSSSIQQDDLPRTNTSSLSSLLLPHHDMDKIQENTVSGSGIPEYLAEYTTITEDSQRRKYKQEFNADYDEYKKLHAVMEKVSRRFAELDARLKQTAPGSPEYKKIKREVYKEYTDNKNDVKHQEAKKRFQYLHEKLSHIKKLVAAYDTSMEY